MSPRAFSICKTAHGHRPGTQQGRSEVTCGCGSLRALGGRRGPAVQGLSPAAEKHRTHSGSLSSKLQTQTQSRRVEKERFSPGKGLLPFKGKRKGWRGPGSCLSPTFCARVPLCNRTWSSSRALGHPGRRWHLPSRREPCDKALANGMQIKAMFPLMKSISTSLEPTCVLLFPSC